MPEGGILTRLFHMSEQAEKAEEFGKALSTKGADGVRGLTSALSGLKGEFASMSDVQLTSVVERLEQALKDYGVGVEQLLFYSRVDENGVECTLEQRAKYLYNQAKVLEDALSKFKDWKVGDISERAMKSTNGSFWKLNCTEGLQTDLEDYVKDVKAAQQEHTEYLRDHEDEAALVVKFAADVDPGFKVLTEGMGTGEALNRLMKMPEMLKHIYSQIPTIGGRRIIEGNDVQSFISLSRNYLGNFWNTDIASSTAEVMRGMDKFMATLKADLEAKDKDFFNDLPKTRKSCWALSSRKHSRASKIWIMTM